MMLTRFSAKQYLKLGTALTGIMLPTPAFADCLINATNTTVTCSTADTNGFQSSFNLLTINVLPGVNVTGGTLPAAAPILSAGNQSVVNNEGAISSAGAPAGSIAISLGGGSRVTEASTATGPIAGDIQFGAAATGQTNTLENLKVTTSSAVRNGNPTPGFTFTPGTASIFGNISSAGGAFLVTNNGGIQGNITSSGQTTINNNPTAPGNSAYIIGSITLGSGDDVINNNGTGGAAFSNISGNIDLGAGNNTLNNTGFFTSVIGNVTAGAGNDTVTNTNGAIIGNLSLGDGTNTINNATIDSLIKGTIILGAGNDTVTNAGGGTWGGINGSIALGDGNNTLNNSGLITGNVTGGAGNDTLANTLATGVINGNIALGGGTDTISNLVGTGTIFKNGTGTLTLSGNNTGFTNAPYVLELNGGTVAIGAANNLPTGGLLFNSGTLQTTGALTIGNAITLNPVGGTVQTDAATTISGVISGPGGLTKTGTSTLILTGANTYTGGTTISAGTLQGTTSTLIGNVVDNGTLVIDNTAGGTFAGNITGTGGLSTINAGTTTLTGNNTYSGATNVGAGTLVVGPTGIGDSSATTIAAGATLQLAANETIGSLAGAGTLTGPFTLTNGGNNTSTTFSGTVTGTGLTKVGTGTLTLSGTGTPATLAVNAGGVTVSGAYTTGAATTVANGGTLTVATGGALTGGIAGAAGSTLVINGNETGAVTNAGTASGTGTVTGAFTNSGQLYPGTNGTTGIFNVVNGPFTQTSTGTLNIDLTPTATPGTGYDQVRVTGVPGTAVLGGTLALHPQTGVLYVAGTNYDVVNAAGGITGAFSSTTGGTISPFLSFSNTGIVTIAGTNQVYRITVARTPFATGIGAGATPNQIAVANGFQGLVTGASGDAATLVIAVDNMTADQARAFFDQASPEPYGAYARSILNQGDLFSRQIHLQTQNTPNVLPGFDVWFRGYGLWGHGDPQSYRFGSDIDTWGGVLGVTYRWSGFYLGAAAGISRDNVHYKLGNSDGHNNGWQGGIFAGYQAGAFDIDAQVDYIHGSIEATRTINVTSINRTAAADTQGHEWKFIATAGYTFNLASMGLRPFIGIDYTTGSLDAFTETGANAANLTVDRIDADRTDLLVGLDLKASPTAKISPYGSIVWRHNLNTQNGNIGAKRVLAQIVIHFGAN